MSLQTDIAQFKTEVSSSITNKTADNSILPQDVGNNFSDLADIISTISGSNGLTNVSESIIGLGGSLTENTNITTGGNYIAIGDTFDPSISPALFYIYNDAGIGISTKGTGAIAIQSNYGDANLAKINMFIGQILMFSQQISGGLPISQVNLTPSSLELNYSNAENNSQSIEFNSNSGGVDNPNNMWIIDTINNKGLEYANDYSSNFTSHSLIDKNYLYTVLSDYGSNGLTSNDTSIILGGILSQDTNIDTSTSHVFYLGDISGNTVLFNIDPTGQTYSISQTDNITAGSITGTDGAVYLNGNDSNSGNYQMVIYPQGAFSLQLSQTTTGNTQIFSMGLGSGSLIQITDNINNKGIEYGGNYINNFTNNSLVSKLYVDNKIINSTPSTSSSAGIKGTIAYDSSFIYICSDTNTWLRAIISTW